MTCMLLRLPFLLKKHLRTLFAGSDVSVIEGEASPRRFMQTQSELSDLMCFSSLAVHSLAVCG